MTSGNIEEKSFSFYGEHSDMTMLASWVGVDTHGICSTYIASDSRFSWSSGETYDYGKKLYASRAFPEIFGYCGDVLFPTVILQQIIEMIDSNLLLTNEMSCAEKNKIIFNKISYELNHYPVSLSNKVFQILHITRETVVHKNKYPNFHAYFISFENGKWKREEKSFPIESGFICILGSGSTDFKLNYERYQGGPNKSTSRNVFHCFIDTLINSKDMSYGGVPQLVGLIRKPHSSGQYYGVLFGDKRYFNGSEIPQDSTYDSIPWRNENFEVCNGRVKKLALGAQSQPDFLRRT